MDKKQYEEQLIANIITSLEKHGAKDLLSSVIITGSFGRKEPTYEHRNDRKLVLKSDVEIALTILILIIIFVMIIRQMEQVKRYNLVVLKR